MRTLTSQERRTIRLASVGIGVYLVLFAGFKLWRFFEQQRADYHRLLAEAEDLKREVKRYEGKIVVTKKLMESFRMDPAKLNRTTVVAEASAAIQKAAREGGFQVGTVRESPARSGSREVSTIQIDGTGPVQATMGLLSRLESCGYPLVIDAAQMTAEQSRPGQVKLSLTIIVLDFESWKKVEVPRV
ncbi:MAG: hypothetical protein RLY20_1135 [Verrucomicrobiota bacterium]|jgi:hypothetical protein